MSEPTKRMIEAGIAALGPVWRPMTGEDLAKVYMAMQKQEIDDALEVVEDAHRYRGLDGLPWNYRDGPIGERKNGQYEPLYTARKAKIILNMDSPGYDWDPKTGELTGGGYR